MPTTLTASAQTISDRAYDRANLILGRLESDARHSAAVRGDADHYPAFVGRLRQQVLRMSVEIELLKVRAEG